MKKLLLIILLILPACVSAKMFSSFNETVNYTDSFFNTLTDSNKYLVIQNNTPFKYNENGLSTDSRFKNMGLINLYEFNASKNEKGQTYLYKGNTYWTMTDSNDKSYMINNNENKYSLENKSVESGFRGTVYIKPNIRLTGNGTYNNPWKFIVPKYRIDFNVNGGNAFTSSTCGKDFYFSNNACYKNLEQNVKYGKLPTPSKTNNTFLGWYTAINEGTKIEENSIFNQDYNAILYAHWKSNEYLVTFNVNGGNTLTSTNCGSGFTLNNSVCSKKVLNNTAYGALPTPTRTNYIFLGWYTATSGGTKVESTTIFNKNENTTLYAMWKLNTYVVTFNVNGGKTFTTSTCGSGFTFNNNTCSKNVSYNTAYGALPTPTKDYYNFLGWYTAASGGTKVETSTVFAGNANITLYAHWKIKYTGVPNKTYTEGETATYGGLDWYVVSNSADYITLLSKSNVATSRFGSSATWSSSDVKSYLNGTWLSSKPVILADYNNGGLIYDNSSASYVRLIQKNELKSFMINNSGTNFWTMTANGSNIWYALSNVSTLYYTYTPTVTSSICYYGSSTNYNDIVRNINSFTFYTSNTETAPTNSNARTNGTIGYTSSYNCYSSYTYNTSNEYYCSLNGSYYSSSYEAQNACSSQGYECSGSCYANYYEAQSACSTPWTCSSAVTQYYIDVCSGPCSGPTAEYACQRWCGGQGGYSSGSYFPDPNNYYCNCSYGQGTSCFIWQGATYNPGYCTYVHSVESYTQNIFSGTGNQLTNYTYSPTNTNSAQGVRPVITVRKVK